MDASDFIYELRKQYELNTTIDEEFYEDQFLDRFDEPYFTLHFDHIDVDYEYVYDNKQTGGNVNIIKKYIKEIKEAQAILTSLNYDISDIFYKYRRIINKRFYDYIKKKYKVDLRGNIYVYATKIPYYINDVFPKDKIIHNKEIKSDNISLILLTPPVQISEKYMKEYFFIVFDAINKINAGEDIVIQAYFSPWINEMFAFYIVLIDMFESVDIIYPTYIGLQKNISFFVLKNKINKKNIPHKLSTIKLHKDYKFYRQQMEHFVMRTIDHINFWYKLEINLKNMKLKESVMYNILKYKLLSKFLG